MSTTTPEDRKELRREWVKSLRSGEYEQGQGRLRIGDEFCCLGVACDLLAKKGMARWNGGVAVCGESEGDVHLPTVAGDFLGLKTGWGSFDCPVSGAASLVDLNDSGKTFAEIADIIESEPEGLFID